MTEQPCGLKVGTRNAQVEILLNRVLSPGESATFSLSLIDINTEDVLFMLERLEMTSTSDRTMTINLQDTRSGRSISYSETGFARACVTWETEENIDLNTLTVQVRFVLHYSSDQLFASATHQLNPSDNAKWVIGR